MFLRSLAPLPGPWLSAFLGLAFVQSGTVWAGPILDQSYDPSRNETVNVGLDGGGDRYNQQQAQTFQVGITGTLTEVDAFVEIFAGGNFDPPTGQLLLGIWQTAASGAPDENAVLASTSISASQVQTFPGGFVSFDLSSFNLRVTKGEELAMVLHVSRGGSAYGWLGAGPPLVNDPYPKGETYGRFIGNYDWIGSPGTDLGFRDFVNPVPEPSSFLLLAFGCVGLLGYGCLKRRCHAGNRHGGVVIGGTESERCLMSTSSQGA